jgi:hypothetical protein
MLVHVVQPSAFQLRKFMLSLIWNKQTLELGKLTLKENHDIKTGSSRLYKHRSVAAAASEVQQLEFSAPAPKDTSFNKVETNITNILSRLL